MELLGRNFGDARGGLCVDRSARIDAGATLRRSVVAAGCRVGPGASVRDSVLWGGVRVGAGAQVTGSVLTGGVRVEPGERLVSVLAFARRPKGAVGGRRSRGRWLLGLGR
jgi:ADP-glucose pyrophosphorylase